MSRSHDSFEVGAGERLAAEIERLIILVRDRFGGDAPSVYREARLRYFCCWRARGFDIIRTFLGNMKSTFNSRHATTVASFVEACTDHYGAQAGEVMPQNVFGCNLSRRRV